MLWELKTSAGFDDSSLFQTVLFEGWGLISLDTRVIAVLEQLYTRVGVGVQGSGFQSICSSSLFSGHPFASSGHISDVPLAGYDGVLGVL